MVAFVEKVTFELDVEMVVFALGVGNGLDVEEMVSNFVIVVSNFVIEVN